MNSNTDEDCITVFTDLKMHKKYRFIVYKVETQKVVIETIGQRDKNWAEFIGVLPKAEPRMCVFDLQYVSHDGMNCSRLFFCYWLPDGTPLKMKLPYASFKESFKAKIDVLGKEIVLTTPDDYTEAELTKQFDK